MIFTGATHKKCSCKLRAVHLLYIELYIRSKVFTWIR